MKPEEDDDALLALAQRAFAGDADARRELFTRITPLARYFAANRTKSKEDARDVEQETLLKLMRSSSQPRTTVVGWVASAVMSVVFDSHKPSRRPLPTSSDSADPSQVPARGGADPLEEASQRELRDSLRKKLQSLGVTSNVIHAIERKYFDGKQFKETAEELRVDYTKLRQQVCRSIRAFREALRQLGLDG